MENVSRRGFVIQSSKLLALLPIAGAIGCVSGTDSKLSPEDSLKRLIYIVGPWKLEEQSTAEDFTRRFVKSNFADSYLPKSQTLVQSLASELAEEAMAVNEIELERIPKEEQEILINLTKQLYSFVEVRLYVCKEPPWGHCQDNSIRHTKIPK